MTQSDDQSGTGAGSAGQEPTGQPYGQPAYDPQQYGRQQYGQPPYGQPEYGQPQYDPQQYGQPQPGQPPYGQAEYGQGQYAQPEYPQPQYGQPEYGQPAAYGQQYGYAQQYGQPQQYGQYGASAVPARPAGVTTAAVFGFVFGALGVLATILLIILGAAASGAAGGVDEQFPGLGGLSGAVGGLVIGVGLVALAWTVLIIWGSIYALSGRSRVLLLVAGSISIFATGISFLSSIGSDQSSGGGVFLSLLFFAMAIAIVVLGPPLSAV
jgi:hypothetical protein